MPAAITPGSSLSLRKRVLPYIRQLPRRKASQPGILYKAVYSNVIEAGFSLQLFAKHFGAAAIHKAPC
jgi:hypothetical protein